VLSAAPDCTDTIAETASAGAGIFMGRVQLNGTVRVYH